MTAQNNVLNQVPYLRTSRLFPEEIGQLVVEVNRSYTDIASAVNNRTISIFPVNRPAIGGESWFVTKNQRQQSLRQVYQFDDLTLTIPSNIDFPSTTNIIRMWGTFFDGTYWQNLPYVDVVNVNNQINVKINPSTGIITITKGAGTPPSISKGLLIVEWISNV